MGEGGWDGGVYLFIQTYLMQQSFKEVSNEKCIGKDQRPKGHSLKANLNLSHTLFFANTDDLASVHLLFLIFESFFHNLNDAKTNYYDYENYKKVNGCEILYHYFLPNPPRI